GKLYKVPLNRGARKIRVLSISQHTVQGMSKLMKEGSKLLKTQQGRALCCSLTEIAYNRDMWSAIGTVFDILIFISSHPGTGSLALAWVIVHIQQSFILAIFRNPEDTHIWMVCLHFFQPFETQAE